MVVAGLLNGCAGGGATAADTSAAVLAAVTPREVTKREQVLLARAEEMLVLRCMTQAGFPYKMVPPPSFDDPAQQFGYVIDDVAWAREHGYGLASEPATQTNPISNLPTDERARAVAALFGPRPEGLSAWLPGGLVLTASDQGCLSAARRELYVDLPRWFTANAVVSNLGTVVDRQVRGDRHYLARTQLWSDCMARTGHRYPSPEKLRETLTELAESMRPDRFAELEREIAVAEARCARQTGFGALTRQLQEELSALIQAEYREDIETLQRIQLAALSRAHAVVAAGSGGDSVRLPVGGTQGAGTTK